MNQIVIEILDRVKTRGARSYVFSGNELKMMFEEHNRLVAEGAINEKPEYRMGCGSCRIKVYQHLRTYLNSL